MPLMPLMMTALTVVAVNSVCAAGYAVTASDGFVPLDGSGWSSC
ncbi:hypothetical protein ABZ684_01510 [Streptomyces sp. NPDC006995]